MDIAYSIDFRDIIDPEKAYELFWKGIILNKQNFEWPDDNCSAQVTCANIEKLEHKMKQGVHYRVMGVHSEKCNYETENISLNSNSSIAQSKENPYKNSVSDNFHLNRPKDYYDKKESDQSENSFSKQKHKQKINSSQKNKIVTSRNYYSIRPMVTKYLNNKNHNTCFIVIKGKSINYETFFSNISKTTFNEISEYPQIYFGEAYINTLKNKNIQIRFKNGFRQNDEDNYTTSIFINSETIEEEKNLYWKKRILKVADSKKSESMVFIYGKPKKNGEYINFNIKNLDFLETRNNLP